jgi:hypothetical protein
MAVVMIMAIAITTRAMAITTSMEGSNWINTANLVKQSI